MTKEFYIVEAVPVTAGQIRGIEPYNSGESQIVDFLMAETEEDAIELAQDTLIEFGYSTWDAETMVYCEPDGSINYGWMHFTARKEKN